LSRKAGLKRTYVPATNIIHGRVKPWVIALFQQFFPEQLQNGIGKADCPFQIAGRRTVGFAEMCSEPDQT